MLYAAAIGLSQGPPADTKDQPVIRVNVDLVQFDVVVTDAKGTHIADLKPEDFQVLDNGKAQRITNFTFIPGRQTASASEPATQAGVASTTSGTPLSTRPDQVTRTIAVVVDDLGLTEQSFMYVRPALERLINDQLQPGDLVAVVTTSGRLGALQRLTMDRQVLRAAVARVRSLPNHREGVTDEDFRSACPATPGDRTDYYTRLSMAALRRIVDTLRELPGRRSILLFSEGMPVVCQPSSDSTQRMAPEAAPKYGPLEVLLPVSDQAAVAEYNALVLHANRSGVSINTIDPRGLIAGFDTAERGSGRTGSASPAQREQALTDTQGMLAAIARSTGGVSVANDNDASAAIAQVMNAESGYYLIGYKPSGRNKEKDNGHVEVRKLSVRISQPGLKLRFHSSLYHDAPKLPASSSERVAAAVVSPFVRPDVRIRLASRYWDTGPATGTMLHTVLRIDAHDLTVSTETDGRRRAVFDITAVVFGAKPTPMSTFEKSYTVTMTEAGYAKALASGMVQRLEFPLKQPGAYHVRCAVRDRNSERIGSTSEFIEVPDLKRGVFALSGIILNAGDMEEVARQTDRVTKYQAGESLFYTYQVLNARPDRSGALGVQVHVELWRDGKRLTTSTPVEVDEKGQSDRKRLILGGDFQMAKQASAGEYTLQLIALDKNAPAPQNKATQTIEFELDAATSGSGSGH